MSSEKNEKRILRISFGAGLLFAMAEFIFAIISGSQSALMDAAYDASELIFIALVLFLTPLFYQPISEKRPYGFSQIESIFLVVKGFMMLSVTGSISAGILESALRGGNPVNGVQVSLFQLALGLASILVFLLMKRQSKRVASPMIQGEPLGWRVDIAYSMGMSVAFFASGFLEKTPLAGITPYFDQIVALLIVLFMLPETLKMLWRAIKDIFLFAPDEDTVAAIKEICQKTIDEQQFVPQFYDITRTGRRLWVSIYFTIAEASLFVQRLEQASKQVNAQLAEQFENCTCELILCPPAAEQAQGEKE